MKGGIRHTLTIVLDKCHEHADASRRVMLLRARGERP
jgi:hypothetical protein